MYPSLPIYKPKISTIGNKDRVALISYRNKQQEQGKELYFCLWWTLKMTVMGGAEMS